MEVKFLESGAKVDNLKSEAIAKLDANDQAVAELQVTVSDVTLSVDENQRAIQQVQAEVERREVELPSQGYCAGSPGHQAPSPSGGSQAEADAHPRPVGGCHLRC